MFALLVAQAPAPASPGAGSGLFGILPFVDRVVTSSGIHGLISNVKETTVIVKVADNVKIEMEKTAVTNVVKTDVARQGATS